MTEEENLSDIDPQQAQETLHILTTTHHNRHSNSTIIHLPLTFQSSTPQWILHTSRATPIAASYNPSKKPAITFLLLATSLQLHTPKYNFFWHTLVRVFNTMLLLIKKSSTSGHYQHELTIIHCLKHWRFFISTFLIFFYMFSTFIFSTPILWE